MGCVGVTAGFLRYGGPAGLLHRVQAEVAARRPHPAYMPTPLPVSAQSRIALSATQPITHTRGDLLGAPALAATSTLTPNGSGAAPTLVPRKHRLVSLPTPTPDAVLQSSTHRPAVAFVELTGLRHQWQTWNNCGPATLAMHLSYFGATVDQSQPGAALRTHEDDKNVMPEELAAYARRQGYEAQVLINGNPDRLRLLLSNGLPVLVETWLEDEPNNGMGHYRLLIGYDDASRQWFAYDSYDRHRLRNPNGAYQGIQFSYEEFEALWKVFNHTYLIIYPPGQAELVRSIVGADLEPQQMWQRALREAQTAAAQQPNDPYLWFNLGSDLTALGRYQEAATAYDQARLLGLPWRMLWYQFGPFEAYYASGRYQEIMVLADATIRTTVSIEEPFYWRGQALAALGDWVGAQRAWQTALKLNPQYTQASEALVSLGD